MRTFAREALLHVAETRCPDPDTPAPEVFELDLAGGCIHPAIRVGSWDVFVVTANGGGPLRDSDFDFDDHESAFWRYEVARNPNRQDDYNAAEWVDDRIVCDGPELVNSIRAMAARCVAADASKRGRPDLTMPRVLTDYSNLTWDDGPSNFLSYGAVVNADGVPAGHVMVYVSYDDAGDKVWKYSVACLGRYEFDEIVGHRPTRELAACKGYELLSRKLHEYPDHDWERLGCPVDRTHDFNVELADATVTKFMRLPLDADPADLDIEFEMYDHGFDDGHVVMAECHVCHASTGPHPASPYARTVVGGAS